ncbi:MAG: DUF6514 family protein [Hominilimicola sp.]
MYKVTEGRCVVEGEEYVVYGICYGEYNIADISTDRAKVEKMVRLFNSEELSPCHMYDVIYDMIG